MVGLQDIPASRIDSILFNYVGSSPGPDFVGRGLLQGFTFDITTTGQVASHLSRVYGQGLNIVTYRRPLAFLLFPE
jgi:hypothetical protein